MIQIIQQLSLQTSRERLGSALLCFTEMTFRLTMMLALSVCALSVDDGWKQVCTQHCNANGDPMIHNMKLHICEGYKHQLPKPRVYHSCNDAFKERLRASCKTLCGGGGHSETDNEHEGHQTCKKQKREVPKPLMYNCCMEGARGAGKAASEYVKHLKTVYAQRIKNEPENTKEDIIKEMLLEADLEQSALAKAGVDEVVVVEEIRAEAEAEVKEIIEEVKKGKTDLDLAREAARAAFKAKQEAEEAEGEGEAVEEIDL